MRATILILGISFLAACSREHPAIPPKEGPMANNGFIAYVIPQGQHYCIQSSFKSVETAEMKCTVRFDSTAVYATVEAGNQYDINKLFGFSDNNMDHHQYSARFGWRWSDGALRLFAYVYNAGTVTSEEISSIPIGAEVECSIKISAHHYIFRVNDTVKYLPRTSATEKGKGYQLYPYFGGDETAPHEIRIWIREE